MLIIYALIFWVAYAGAIKVLFGMMQNDGAFNIISSGRWGSFRDRLYGSEDPKRKALEMILGGCEKCTALWWSLPWAVLYGLFVHFAGVLLFDSAFANVMWFILVLFINFYSGFISLTRGL